MKYKLKDTCLVITDGSHFSPKDSGIGFPMFSVKDMREYGFDYSNCKHVSIEDFQKLKDSGCVPQKDDILVAKDGSYLKEIFLCKETRNEAVLSSIAIFRPNKKVITPAYLCYLLKSPRVFNYIKNNCVSGSALPRIVLKTFKEVSLDVPPIEEQEKVIRVLKPLDDKIELNNRINENLENQAQALYENLCLTHSTGTLVSLADLMDYAGGSQPPASEFIYEEKEGYIRFVQIRDYDTDSHLTYIPESPRNKLCEEHDIMIARYGASLGRICSGLNGAYNVALAKVFPKEQYYREFLRCYLSSREFYEGINNKGGRSAQAGFNQSDIKSFELILPDKPALIQFEGVAAFLFEQRLNLRKENIQLALLRDFLLPKLMSGELDVSEIDL